MKTTYEAESLDDIAALFRNRAEACDKIADQSRLKATIDSARIEAATWRAAQEIVQSTTLIVDAR